MILANYTQENRNTYSVQGVAFSNPLAQFNACLINNFYAPNDSQAGRDLSAFNNGYNSEYAWNLPLKSGGLSSTLNIVGSGTVTAPILAVKLAEAGLTGSGDLSAIGGLIVQLLADLVGSGEISDADMKAFLQLAASISGTGEASDAQLTGLGALVAALLGDGTAAASILTGNGAMAADLVVTGTGLTTANVGQAVWSAIAASNNVSGTMGEKLNDAGSAGNPWASLLADNNTPGTFGYYVQNLPEEVRTEITTELTRLSELWALHGLDSANPVTATPTSRVTGTISQTITGDGSTNTTITRD